MPMQFYTSKFDSVGVAVSIRIGDRVLIKKGDLIVQGTVVVAPEGPYDSVQVRAPLFVDLNPGAFTMIKKDAEFWVGMDQLFLVGRHGPNPPAIFENGDRKPPRHLR